MNKTDRVMQVANLDPNGKRKNSNNLRVYLPIGVAPCLNEGQGWKSPYILIIDE